MVIYILIFLLLVLSVFIEAFGDKKSATIIWLFTLTLLLFITSNREGIGTDFYNYKSIYEDIIKGDSYTVEFGFVVLNYLASLLGGFKVLLFLAALLNLVAIIFVLSKFKLNISIGILTYYSIFYLNHNFNTIRHGLMAAFVWIGFYFYLKRNKIKLFLFYFISFLFHQVAIVFYPLQFLTQRRINFKYSIGLLLIFYIIGEALSSLFVFLNVYISQFSTKLDFYINDYYGDEVVKYKFGSGFFLYVLIYFIILKFENYFENKKEIIFFNRLLFLGIATIILFASFSIFSERIANVLLISLVFIFGSFAKVKIKSHQRFVLLVLLIMTNFFYLLKILSIPGINREYQFIPYTFTFF